MKNRIGTFSEKEKQDVFAEIQSAMEKIEYGEVVITIHEAKVVQIEKREKRRFK